MRWSSLLDPYGSHHDEASAVKCETSSWLTELDAGAFEALLEVYGRESPIVGLEAALVAVEQLIEPSITLFQAKLLTPTGRDRRLFI